MIESIIIKALCLSVAYKVARSAANAYELAQQKLWGHASHEMQWAILFALIYIGLKVS